MKVDKNLGPSGAQTQSKDAPPDKGVVVQSGTVPKPVPFVGGYSRE